MSRKDYRSIAAAICRETDSEVRTFTTYNALRRVADELCVAFKQDNPRFDRGKFLDACGFGS